MFKKTLDQLDEFHDYIEPYEHVVKGFRDVIVKMNDIIRLAFKLISTIDDSVRVTKLFDARSPPTAPRERSVYDVTSYIFRHRGIVCSARLSPSFDFV